MPSDRKLLKKIEKYEKRLKRLQRKQRRSYSRSRSRTRSRSRVRLGHQDVSPVSPLSDPPPDAEDMDEDIIDNLDEQTNTTTDKVLQLPTAQCSDSVTNASQENNENTIAAFRDALGVEYEDCNKFEGEIQTEITKRWNHILVNGLTKEEKDGLMKKYKLPENCQLLEAPILNDEVKSVMTESSKIRDRSLETVQHQLGLATAIVGLVMTQLIEKKDIDRIQLVAKLTDASKLLNDINFQQTRTRKLLISPLLDKSFNNLIEKVKRDEHLYGLDLATKIKTSQELKKSSSQIKKTIPKPGANKSASTKKAGNRYGPPRTQPSQQTRATAPRGGPRNRVTQPPPHRAGRSRSRPERAAPRGSHNKC